jgi:ATP-dependent RNA helicase SUPV3L1/SUV3
VGADAYRVGGFRSCGDRVVRVDIVERLADMIRAASTLRVINGSPSGPAAFQVTSQMTSLTGCSGEGFASILKALGFESLTTRRGEIVWPAAAAPVAAPAETTVAPGPEAGPAEGDPDDNPDTAALAAAAEAPPASDPAPDVEPVQPVVDASVAEPAEISSDADVAPSDPPTGIETAEQVAVEIQPEAPPVLTDDEIVTIWRFARPPASSHPRPARQPQRRFAAPAGPRTQPQQAATDAPDGHAASESRAPRERRAPPSERPVHEGKRKTWDTKKTQRRPDDKRDARALSGDRPTVEKKPAIDPMSPFAKLMELRSILESESKKRS